MSGVWKDSVSCASTANTTVGSNLSATPRIDDVDLVAGMRVLLKNQLNLAENGIYSYSTSPSRTLARATDAGSTSALNYAAVYVEQGTVNQGRCFRETNAITSVKNVQNVGCASTGNVSIATPPSSIDGVTLTSNMRILLKDQTTLSQNGVYQYNGSGTALSRTSDADTGAKITDIVVEVSSGTVNAGKYFHETDTVTTIGTDPIEFTAIDASTLPNFSVELFTQTIVPSGVTGSSPDVTIDRVRIQNAINAVNADGGGVVQLGRGTFYIDTNVQLKSGVTLQGAGMGATTLLCADVTDAALYCSASIDSTSNPATALSADALAKSRVITLAGTVSIADGTDAYLREPKNNYSTGFVTRVLSSASYTSGGSSYTKVQLEDALPVDMLVSKEAQVGFGTLVSNIGVRDLTLKTDATTPASRDFLLQLNDAREVVVSKVQVEKARRYPLRVNVCRNVNISGCRVAKSGYDQEGINIYNSTGVVVDGCFTEKCSFGINAQHSHAVTVSNCFLAGKAENEGVWYVEIFKPASLTSSGTAVTVTASNHGLSVNDYVAIGGAKQSEYNGRFQVTSVTSTTFQYTASATPSKSPAEGAPGYASGKFGLNWGSNTATNFDATQDVSSTIQSSLANFYVDVSTQVGANVSVTYVTYTDGLFAPYYRVVFGGSTLPQLAYDTRELTGTGSYYSVNPDSRRGIKFEYGTVYSTAIGNTIQDHQFYGIYFSDAPFCKAIGNTIVNTGYNTARYGIVCGGFTSTYTHHQVIQDNLLSNIGGYGIVIAQKDAAGISAFSVIDGNVLSVVSNGINVGMSDINVTNNIVANFGSLSTNVGILAVSGVQHTLIQGNRLWNGDTPVGIGIDTHDAGNSSIGFNHLSGLTSNYKTGDTFVATRVDGACDNITSFSNPVAFQSLSASQYVKSNGSKQLVSQSGVPASDLTGTLSIASGGTNKTSFVAGSIVFAGAGGSNLAEANANLFWDNTNNRLGIGNNSPSYPLDVSGSDMRLKSSTGGTVFRFEQPSGSTGRIQLNTNAQFAIKDNVAGVDRLNLDTSGRFGIGTLWNISARLHVISTTEQLRIGYDTSNYYSTTVNSAGGVTFNAVVTSPGFTFADDVTHSDGTNIVAGSTVGLKIGTSASQKLGFFNSSPIVQPASANQAAVSTTPSTQTTPYGYSTQAQADGVVTLLNEIRSSLVNLGLMKGSA